MFWLQIITINAYHTVMFIYDDLVQLLCLFIKHDALFVYRILEMAGGKLEISMGIKVLYQSLMWK